MEPVPIERLLRHRAWVRRLALAMANDAASADDLEQETWVAAMRRPPRSENAVRSWFRRVMRNRVHQMWRTASRSDRREKEAARPDGEGESPDEAVARAEAQRAIVNLVFDLDEPYRTTMILRYFEELSPVETAKRLEVAPNTVRQREKRALTLLRGRLDRRYGGPIGWAVLLGVGATQLAAPAAASTTTLKTTVVASSTKKIVVGVAVAAVLLSGIALWQHLQGAVAPAPRSTGAPEDGTNGTGPGPHDAPATAPGDEERGPDARGAVLLSGEVRFARDDTPAADHPVVLDGPAGRATVRTDAAGYFAFARLAAGGPYDLRVEAPACATVRVTGTILRGGEHRHLETLWLDRPLAIRARVLDPRGIPVAAARVEAFRARRRAGGQDWAGRAPRPVARATSGKDGVAVLADLAPGRWTFRATHPEFAAAGVAERPLLRGGATVPIELVLQSGYALRGRIVDAHGAPLAESVVLALRPREATASMRPFPIDPLRVETRTDADGRYEFARLPHGGHAIAVVPEGGLECRIGVVEVPAVDVFDVRLDGGVLTGRVTDLDTGEPLAGAEVRGGFWRRHHPTFFSAVTDAGGAYRIVVPLGGYLHPPARGGRSRPVNLDVTKPGYVLAPSDDHMQWNSAFPLRGAEVTWDLRMRRAATLGGVVRGPDGPVPGARVRIEVWNGFRGLVPHGAVTRGDGSYAIDGILAGRALIRVEKPGFFQDPAPSGDWLSNADQPPEVATEIPKSGRATLDATLRRGATLAGRVLAADGDAPVAAARVAVSWPGAAPVATTTDDAGAFGFASVRPGVPVRVTVAAPGFEDHEREATAGEPIEIRLAAAGRVAGRVLARGGGAPEGVFVQVAPSHEVLEGRYEVASVWQRVPRRPVAPDGTFTAPLAAAGEAVLVRAVAPGFAPALSEPVRAGGDVRIVLEPGHVLRGVVVAADGSGPLAGVRVEFSNERLPPELGQRRDWSGSGFNQHPFEIVGVTKEDGTFEVRDLPPFTYRLRVTSPHHGTAQPSVRVPGDGPVRVELAMPTDLAGRVTYEDGTPAAWVLVRAHAPGAGFTGMQATTAEDGRFRIQAWEEGPFRLEVRQDWRTPVDVVPLLTEEAYATGRDDVALTVRRGTGSVTGRCVAYGGEGVPGAWIHVRAAEGGPVFSTRTNARGEYTVTGLKAESVRLRAFAGRTLGGPERANRPLVAEAGPLRAGSAGIDLELQPAQTIAGRVLGPDGEPVAGGLTVRARADEAWAYDGAVGADGAFTVRYLLPRTYALTLHDERTGRAVPLADEPRARAGAEGIELRVRATRAIEGDIVDADGKPVPGAGVFAVAGGRLCGSAETDLKGRYRLSGLPDEPMRIIARHHRLGRLVRDGVAAGTTGVRLRLEPQPPLRARLVDNAGAPLRKASVDLVHESGGPRARVETDAEGRLSTRALPPGTYRVALVARDGRPLADAVPCGTIRSGNPEVVLRVD